MKGLRLLPVCTLVIVWTASVCAALPRSCSESVPLHLTITTSAAPTVGEEGVFTVVVTADRSLPDVSVRVELPVGASLVGPGEQQLGAIKPDDKVILSARAVFSNAGTAMVRAVAVAPERPGVVWSAVAYLPLTIGTSRSYLGLSPDALVVRPEMAVQGSAAPAGWPSVISAAAPSGEPPVKEAAAAAKASSAPAPQGTLTVSGTWQFRNRANAIAGQQDNALSLRRGSDGAVLAYTYTDDSGNFTFPAITNPTPNSVYVRCHTFTDYGGFQITSVTPPGGDIWEDVYTADSMMYIFPDGAQSVGTWVVTHASPTHKAWWIKDDMIKAFNVPPDETGQHVAEWSPTNTDGTYYDGRMHLLAADADDTPDTVLHEMGHSVMVNIYGGYWPPNPNCKPHSLLGESSTGCAWTEGWAHVWHMWSTNDPIRDYPGGGAVDLENRTWGDGNDEGDDVEGRVAGAIWDITDTPDDGHDQYDGSWLDVWDVMWNVNCDTFAEFWDQWKSRGHPTHGPVGCIYENTIDYNTTPTFGGLPNRTTAEDTPYPDAISLYNYASDPESTDFQLNFEIYNVEHEEIGITMDAGRRLDIDPDQDWTGSSNVTIACSDLIRTVYDTFTVTVTPVNDAPVMSAPGDRTLPEDTPQNNAIDLYVYASDVDNTDAELTFDIVGNTNPSCGVTIDSNRYIDINPAANWYGSSTITIRVTDLDLATDMASFTIYVNAVNDPPVISGLPNRTLAEDTSLNNTIDLWTYASDVENIDDNLAFYVHSMTDDRVGVSVDSGRYIDINPEPNFDGISDVTIRVRDTGGLEDFDTFRVTVTGINDPPTIGDLPDVMVPVTIGDNEVFDLDSFASDPETKDIGLIMTIMSSSNPNSGVSIDAGHCIDVNPGAGWMGYSDVVVRVSDPAGLWDEDTFRVVAAYLCPTITEARSYPNDTWVGVTQRYVSATFDTLFYIQDPGPMSGIGVNYTGGPAPNTQVRLAGPLSTSFAERRITPYMMDIMGSSPPIRPLGMTNGAMGGSSPNAYTVAVPPTGQGLYNVGLLARTTGKVMRSISNAFYIWDGSSVIDSRPSTQEPWLRVLEPPSGWQPPLGSYVTVTGVSGAETLSGKPMRVLRPRSDDDIVIDKMRVLYVGRSSYSEAQLFKNLLDPNGLQTDIVQVDKLSTVDMSQYQVVIIGNDSAPWGEPNVSIVLAPGVPIIGIGAGGVLFFEAVTSPDLFLGTTNSTPVTNQVYGQVVQGDIYDYPYVLPSTPGYTLQIAGSPGLSVAALNDPGGVTFGMLRRYGSGTSYVLASQDRFYQWGFYGQPDKMTELGRQLFVNLVFSTAEE